MNDRRTQRAHLSERQYEILREALFKEWDWHHSEGHSELASEYQELLERFDIEEREDPSDD